MLELADVAETPRLEGSVNKTYQVDEMIGLVFRRSCCVSSIVRKCTLYDGYKRNCSGGVHDFPCYVSRISRMSGMLSIVSRVQLPHGKKNNRHVTCLLLRGLVAPGCI